jgi:hypothetical protein
LDSPGLDCRRRPSSRARVICRLFAASPLVGERPPSGFDSSIGDSRMCAPESSETNIPTNNASAYGNSSAVPFIYFDGVACHGSLHGVVKIELAARILIPTPDGGVELKFVPTGRLRCSPAAAASLRQSIEIAVKMAQHAQQQLPAAVSILN